jgi:hypothetical protein
MAKIHGKNPWQKSMAKIHGKNPWQKLPKNPAKNPWQKLAKNPMRTKICLDQPKTFMIILT